MFQSSILRNSKDHRLNFDFLSKQMVSSNHSVQSSIGGDSDKSNTHSSAETGDFPNSTVFVGDLSIFVTEGDLVLAFQPFGSIVDAKVMRCEETHKNLSYGFVKFSESAAAVAAMEDLNGKLLCGRPMR
jgi:RNA recognition motif-containing protein